MSLEILQQKTQTTITQVLQENLNVFNDASGGTIILSSGDTVGDTIEQLSWGLISNLVTDRNAYAAAGTPAFHRVLSQMMSNKINLSGKVGPVVITNGMMKKLQTDINQIATVFSTQATQGILLKYLQLAIGSAYGAISTNSAAIRTSAAPIAPNAPVGSKYPTLRELGLTAALFGDQASNIQAWVMTGQQFAQFEAYDVIDNPRQLFEIGTTRMMADANGRRFVVTDAVQDIVGDSVLGLSTSGVIVTSEGQTTVTDSDATGENVVNLIRSDFDYGVAVKGYRIKAAVRQNFDGIKSYGLTDATTGTNWELVAPVGTDNAPMTIDGVNPNVSNAGGKGGSTGTLMQQAAQATIAQSLKETAGVIMNLTGSTTSNTTVAGS